MFFFWKDLNHIGLHEVVTSDSLNWFIKIFEKGAIWKNRLSKTQLLLTVAAISLLAHIAVQLVAQTVASSVINHHNVKVIDHFLLLVQIRTN